MDNRSYAYEEPEAEINLLSICWDLLSQWKAILIVALLAAVLLPGVKMLRDNKSYQVALKQAEEEQAQAELPAEEGVEQILSSLSSEDRDAVEVLVQQQELVNTQTTYLTSSLVLRADPANQRTLYVRYVLRTEEGVEVVPLADAYMALLRKNTSVREIGAAIDPSADLNYIYELIGMSYSAVPDSNASEVLMVVSVVLTEDADADEIAGLIDSTVASIHDNLVLTIGGHSVEPLDRNETRVYNTDIVNRKATLVSSINSNKAAIKTAVAVLTADQKAAFEKITALLATGDESAETEATDGDTANAKEASTSASLPKAPSFSKKFALIGFVLGVVLYAICYVVLVVVRGRVGSADVLADYTGCRLLGDVYCAEEHKGLSKLFHSKFVSKRRYGSKGSVDAQVARICSTAESVCKHADVDSVHVLNIGGGAGVAQGLVSSLAAAGVAASVVDVTTDTDEKVLLPVKNAIYCVDSKVKASDVWKVSCLCRSYDVQQLGNVFVCGY